MRPFDLTELSLPKNSPILSFVKHCRDVQPVRFDEGDYLFNENELSRDVYLVLSGAYVIEQGRTPLDGRPTAILSTVMSEPDSPSFVGEMAYLGKVPRTASVRSSGCTFALQLKPQHLDLIIEKFPFLTQILCRQFAERLRETNNQFRELQSLLAMNASHRFAKPEEVLFRKGDKAELLYQLISGEAIREETGESLTPDNLPAGFIEPGCFLRGGQYPYTVKSTMMSLVVFIKRDSHLAFIRNYPEVVLGLL